MRRRGAIAGLLVAVAAAAAAAACAPSTKVPTSATATPAPPAVVRVYTSMYQEVLDALTPVLAKRLGPGVHVEWVQGGSEAIAARVERGEPADLLAVSDPAVYRRMAAEGAFVPYRSTAAAAQPAAWRDPDGRWATLRFSTMVIGLSPEAQTKEYDVVVGRPKRFEDVAKAKGERVAIGDPKAHGTCFTALAVLSGRYGADWLRRLAVAGVKPAGGNATVVQELDAGDADVGIVLLENLLAARAHGSRVGVVFPSDGAVVIPGQIALLARARSPEAARKVYDALLSPEAQREIAGVGFMHTVDPEVSPPEGVPPLPALLGSAPPEAPFLARPDDEVLQIAMKALWP